MKLKNRIRVAIDSPSAAGAGSLAKLISRHYSLTYLDTGKIYRLIGKIYLENPKKFSYTLVRKITKNLNLKKLQDKKLLSDEVAEAAAIVAKDKKIRQQILGFQRKIAYSSSSCLDGRDICSHVVKDAHFKFYITANVKIRARRRFKELKKFGRKVQYSDVLKKIKKRDLADRSRAVSPLIFTKGSRLINNSKLSIKDGFLKIKRIMDEKLK